MIYCFYVGICLCLLILQTTLFPHLPLLDSFYDLLIPFIIYLALYQPLREGVLLVLFLGFIMDNISGGPFGLYLTAYCWLLIGVVGTTKFVQVGNRVLLSVVVAAGVLIENLLFIAIFTIMGPEVNLPAGAWRTVFIQLLWALGTGPFLLLLFKHSHGRVDHLMEAMFARQR